MGSPGFTQEVNNSKVETLAEVKEGCDVLNPPRFQSEIQSFLQFMAEPELIGPRIYSCCNCRNHVSLHDDIISKAFQVNHLSLTLNLNLFQCYLVFYICKYKMKRCGFI